jgi:hypothetical protein
MKRSNHSKSRKKLRKITESEIKQGLKKGDLHHVCEKTHRVTIKHNNLYLITSPEEDVLITQYKSGEFQARTTLKSLSNSLDIRDKARQHEQTNQTNLLYFPTTSHQEDEIEGEELSYEEYIRLGKKKAS